jgi:hypothetical protein
MGDALLNSLMTSALDSKNNLTAEPGLYLVALVSDITAPAQTQCLDMNQLIRLDRLLTSLCRTQALDAQIRSSQMAPP